MKLDALKIMMIGLVLTSCKITVPATDDSDSDLQEIKMGFSQAALPWLDSISDQKKRDDIISTFKMSLTATPTKNQKCTSVPKKTVDLKGGQASIVVPQVKLTRNCEYKILIEIADTKLTYFQTAEASLVKTVPSDGKIIGYKICLKDAGEYFDAAKASNCVDAGDVNIEINPDFGTNSDKKPNIGDGKLLSRDQVLDGVDKVLSDMQDILKRAASDPKYDFDSWVSSANKKLEYSRKFVKDAKNSTDDLNQKTCGDHIREYNRAEPASTGWTFDRAVQYAFVKYDVSLVTDGKSAGSNLDIAVNKLMEYCRGK